MFERVEDIEKSKSNTEKFDETLHRNFRLVEAPPGHGEIQDLAVRDNTGRHLVLRTEDGDNRQFKAVREKDTGQIEHPVRLRVYDGAREAGRANLTLEITKQYNNESGHYERVSTIRMRLNDIEVMPESRRQGVGTLLLEQAEELARRSGARELYGAVASEDGRIFFAANGHEFRKGRQGEGSIEHYKQL